MRCRCGAHFLPESGSVAKPGAISSATLPPAASGAVPSATPKLDELRGRKLEQEVAHTKRWLPLLVPLCGLLGAVAFYAVAWIVFRNTFIGDVLLDRGWVPYVVVFLSTWSGCQLVVKQVQLRREFAALRLDLLPTELGERISAENAGRFREHILNVSKQVQGTLITRRLLKALHQFETRDSGQELSDYLSRQSENDLAAAEGNYSMIRVFIWAIPILGFIGTVLGIGEAVGMFSDAIAATGELQAIKDSLGGVTTGLAWAFDTTLVALVMSLIVMLPTSSMQTREEALVGAVDAYCDEHLVLRILEQHEEESIGELVHRAVAEGLEQHSSRMDAWTDRVEGAAETLADQLASGWRRVQEQSSAHYDEVLGKTGAHHDQVLARYRVQHEALLAHSKSVLEQARDEGREVVEVTRTALADAAAARAGEGDRMAELLTRWQEQQAAMQAATAESVARMSEALSGAHEAMERDANAARASVEASLAGLAPEVESRLAEVGAKATDVWTEQLARLTELQERAHADLERMQQAVDRSSSEGTERLVGLGEEFRGALAAAGDALSGHLAESQAKLGESVEALRAQVEQAGQTHVELIEGQRAVARETAEGLSDQAELLSKASEQLVSGVRERLDGVIEGQQAALEESRRAQSEALEAWAAAFQRNVEASGDGLAAHFNDSRASLDAAVSALAAHMDRTAEVQKGMVEEQHKAARETVAGLERAGERVGERAAETADSLARTSRELLEEIGTKLDGSLERQLAAVDASRRQQAQAMTDAAERIGAALEAAQGKLDRQAQAISDSLGGHEQLVAIQRGLASNLELLARSDALAQTLSRLDTRLEDLTKVMRGLEGPSAGERGLFGRIFRGDR